MASPPVVLFERRGHVGIFTLNRPSAMNAVSGEVAETMERLMDAFEA
jgi:enoyl-CoA hydratase